MATDLYVEIGERLRQQRKKMGMTQDKAAELLGISSTYYGEIERGNRKISVQRVLTVYEKMGLEPTYLLTGRELSGKELTEVFRDCPKEKENALKQILQYLSLLYK